MLFVTEITEICNSGKDHRSAAGPEYGGIRYRDSVYFRYWR